jgi:protein-arginine kinase activator protein McsA
VSQDDDDFDIEETVNDYSSSSMEDLEKQLQGALEQEDYELASKLRDEIKKRNP